MGRRGTGLLMWWFELSGVPERVLYVCKMGGAPRVLLSVWRLQQGWDVDRRGMGLPLWWFQAQQHNCGLERHGVTPVVV